MSMGATRPGFVGLTGAPPRQLVGRCPRCGVDHHVQNAVDLAVAALEGVFGDLLADVVWPGLGQRVLECHGKMVGVLLARDSAGRSHRLLAYSGDLQGGAAWPGWVDGVMLRGQLAELEAQTLERIAALDAQLEASDVATHQAALAAVEREVAAEAAVRRPKVLAARQARGLMRRDGVPEAEVARLALETKTVNAAAMAAEEARLEAARAAVEAALARDRGLRAQRAAASARLMAAMFDVTLLTSARGETRRLRDVFVGGGIASGTGECAAPKLLHAANTRGLTPVAMAEAWWGPTTAVRRMGEISAPCTRKCVPILGHLLCGVVAP
jgi:tRNA pseudouridine32 synthase/23S rRNA pseudouridine746 synthase